MDDSLLRYLLTATRANVDNESPLATIISYDCIIRRLLLTDTTDSFLKYNIFSALEKKKPF